MQETMTLKRKPAFRIDRNQRAPFLWVFLICCLQTLWAQHQEMPGVLAVCSGSDIDYCDASDDIDYNFYWQEMWGVNGSPFFSGASHGGFSLTEYEDGTALIQGTTVQGSCTLTVHIVLKDRKDWEAWSANGGGFKNQGCSNPDKTELTYYIIDAAQSFVEATGGDCLEEGTFIVSQRPDPNTDTTAIYGTQKGVGAALFDTDTQAVGISGWGFMGPEDDKKRWNIDFNFLLACSDQCTDDTQEQVVICPGADYFWERTGSSYTLADSPVTVTLQDDNGCDYSATLIIEEHPEHEPVQEEVVLCANTEYQWALTGETYNPADSPVIVTLQDANGCDYQATLVINTYPETQAVEDQVTICPDTDYFWERSGSTYTLADSPVTISLQDDNGCPYTATLVLNAYGSEDADDKPIDAACLEDDVLILPYFGDDTQVRITFLNKLVDDQGNGLGYKFRLRNGTETAVTNVEVRVGAAAPIYSIETIPARTEVFFIHDAPIAGLTMFWDGGSKGTASTNETNTKTSCGTFEDHQGKCPGDEEMPPPTEKAGEGIAMTVYQQPFSGAISMELEMPYASEVLVEFMDLGGRMVKKEPMKAYSPGTHSAQFDVRHLATEVHLLRITTQRETITRKVIIRR
ncbi:hypothetical protein ABV409_13830 [Flagellimonas sp. DF-77]|uniref:hypothetical protein n=1 Tax=Flagellimonas algarum TaxID=3230298 RepID=UPI003399A22A